MYRWDFTLYKDGERVFHGCDFNTRARTEKNAAKEIINEYENPPEDLLDGDQE